MEKKCRENEILMNGICISRDIIENQIKEETRKLDNFEKRIATIERELPNKSEFPEMVSELENLTEIVGNLKKSIDEKKKELSKVIK